MVVLGVGDDSRVERCCVIGTQQPERYGVVEGDVEQRLMTMALGQFVGTAFGIDRFSDTTEAVALANVGVHKVTPGWNDASRIGAHVGHIGELNVPRSPPESRAQQTDLLGAHHDKGGLTGRDAVSNKARCASQELVLSGIEQRLMPVARYRRLNPSGERA